MPVIRINDDTAEALRALALPSDETADDLVRRLVGLPAVERKARGWAKGQPRGCKWPFASMAVGDFAEYMVPVMEWAAINAAVNRAAKDGKRFVVPTTTSNGIIRITRVA